MTIFHAVHFLRVVTVCTSFIDQTTVMGDPVPCTARQPVQPTPARMSVDVMLDCTSTLN